MNSTVQGQIELSAVLNLIPYLDTDFNYDCEMSLADIVAANEKKFKNNKIIAKLKSMSAGYKYATANPQIVVDTYKRTITRMLYSKDFCNMRNW